MTLVIQPVEGNSFQFEPLTAVSFSRVSTERQVDRDTSEEGFSLAAQPTANKRHALSLGATEFVERGAFARATDRPELRRLLEYVTSHKADIVIAHKLDRPARNRADGSAATKPEAGRHGREADRLDGKDAGFALG